MGSSIAREWFDHAIYFLGLLGIFANSPAAARALKRAISDRRM